MKRHMVNAACGVVDYAAYPLAMLFVGPFTLHRLGAEEFGMWMIATAVISSGGIIASGFSDAHLRHAAGVLAQGDREAARRSTQTLMAVNLVCGTLVTVTVLLVAPIAAARIAAHDSIQYAECLQCLRLAAVGIVLRAIHSVGVLTQRASQDFRRTVRISTVTHLVTLSCAAALVALGFHSTAVLLATIALLAVGTVAQCWQVRSLLGPGSLLPILHREAAENLLRSGSFLWLQTAFAVTAERADRLLLGLTLGAASIAPYVLCVQIAQPLIGLTGSGLSFLFPYLSGVVMKEPHAKFRGKALQAFGVNVLLVTVGSACTLMAGTIFIDRWLGESVREAARPLLLPVVAGSSMWALSVSGIYGMQALGRFRTLAWLSIGSRLLLLPLMVVLLKKAGLQGLAFFRLCAGAGALLVYAPLARALWPSDEEAAFGLPAASFSGGKDL